VVAAEDQRQQTVRAHASYLLGDAGRRLQDLVQEAGTLRAAPVRLRQARLHVAAVVDFDSGALEALAQAGVADRRRPHVDATPPRAEVERCSEDGDPS
jgi:hypothetical protein